MILNVRHLQQAWVGLARKGEAARQAATTTNKKAKQANREAELAATQPKESPTPTSASASVTSKFKPFRVPGRVNGEFAQFTRERRVAPGQPMFDPVRPGALVLPRPPPGHALHTERLVDVVVDPFVSRHLRPHQREGIAFLYPVLLGFRLLQGEAGMAAVEGAVLGDEMGLGKTLQTVGLVWTLLKQSPVAGATLARKVLIVAPSSLLRNWEAEFRKWLGSERLTIHVADTGEKVAQFRSYNTAPVLILSYEMLVRAEAEVKRIGWDFIVCDEAHRMKNAAIKTSAALAGLACKRRLLLTGTPIQNDLGEFYNLLELACPGLLGTRQQFRQLEAAVEAGRRPDCETEERETGRAAMAGILETAGKVMIRRTSAAISRHLPPRTVSLVFCRPGEYQARLYSRAAVDLLESGQAGPAHLAAIQTLRKLCNAPGLVGEVAGAGAGGPPTWEEQAGKLAVLTCLLLGLEATHEKMVIVSLSTATLDLLADLCSRYSVSTCRLDGSTPPAARQGLVNTFNRSEEPRVFLLSSKAGGTGLNLTGASRLVLYDIDWNPAIDLQVGG